MERDAWVLALLRPILETSAGIADCPVDLRNGPFLPKQLAVGLENTQIDLCARSEDVRSDDPMQALSL